MKRLLCILLSLTMLLCLAACGDDSKKDEKKDDKGGKTTTTASAEAQGDSTTTTGAGTAASSAEGSTTATTEGSATKAPSGTTGGTKPTATKPTQPTTGEDSAIRILAIGDSYAVDAMEKYLYDLLKGVGYDTVHLGILYADKSTLDTHYTAVNKDSKTYEFRQNNSGKWTKESNVAPSTAFKKTTWDYVVLQQAGVSAGMDNTYGKLNDLTAAIQKQCKNAALYWHMGWSFRRQSDVDGFENYKYNATVMYEAIVETSLKRVMRNNEMIGIIPTATAIQNLRTSTLRDDLTKDGVRLTDYGAYAAALTWYAILTGESAADVTYRPAAVKSRFAELAEAADNAVSTPNEVTSATAGEGEIKDLKILSIGHSFSLDAMRTYMWDAFDAAGYNVTIGYLYYPSCSLEQHYHYITNNSKSYEQYGKNADGKWVTQSNVDAKTALWDEDWDIVTFQPDPDFGYDTFANGKPCYCEWGCNANISSDYLHFDQLVDKVLAILADPKNPNGPNTDVKLYYHLTWTWRQDCYLGKYLYPKGYDQLTLWQDFINATDNKVLTNKNILGVIPCNTAIENARTTWMGDTFNAEGSNDGYHLNDKGDLVAALTWVSYFTGVKASKIFVDSGFSDEEYAAITESVDNAIAKPREVTQSKYKTEP